jgi:glycerol-3-phosphate acyltransferase PlsY
MALGVFVCFLTLPILSWFAWNWFVSARYVFDDRITVTVGLVCIALMGAVKRLAVRRVHISRDVPIGELLLNRLLFDRDIRDRKAWIDRRSV